MMMMMWVLIVIMMIMIMKMNGAILTGKGHINKVPLRALVLYEGKPCPASFGQNFFAGTDFIDVILASKDCLLVNGTQSRSLLTQSLWFKNCARGQTLLM